MAVYYGNIAYAGNDYEEVRPGVFEPVLTIRPTAGIMIRDTRQMTGASDVNSDINVTNKISIIADPFICEQYQSIVYVELYGQKWKVKDAEFQPPRVTLSLGGLHIEP